MTAPIEVLRGAASVTLFLLFGLGALALSPLMLLLRRPEYAQPVIRTLWRPLLLMFEACGLVRVETDDFRGLGGTVLVANHPSLIDVVMLVVKVPRLMYVAKSALRSNPFLAAIVRATALPDGPDLPAAAAPYLARGWNVLIFPEGTRSPLDGPLHPFRRGAAQLALRTHSPITVVGLAFSRRLLAKRQSIADMGDKPVKIHIRNLGTIDAPPHCGDYRAEAAVLTEELRRRLLEFTLRPA